jgi:hypothetical protein
MLMRSKMLLICVGGLITFVAFLAILLKNFYCHFTVTKINASNRGSLTSRSLNKLSCKTYAPTKLLYLKLFIVTDFFPTPCYFFCPSNGAETSCNTVLLFHPNRWKMCRNFCHLIGWTKHVMLRNCFHLKGETVKVTVK